MTPATRKRCRSCPHPTHLGTCTRRNGGTAYACGCEAQDPELYETPLPSTPTGEETPRMTITSLKAIPVDPAQPVPDLELRFTDDTWATVLQSTMASHAAQRGLFTGQAERIVDALLATLPGGLVDAIVAQLIDRRRGVLAVPHEPPRPAAPALR